MSATDSFLRKALFNFRGYLTHLVRLEQIVIAISNRPMAIGNVLAEWKTFVVVRGGGRRRNAVVSAYSSLQEHDPIEEEHLDHYDRAQFASIKPGQILFRRYKILAKLGYGIHATIWLCLDNQERKYRALKIGVARSWGRGDSYRSQSRELIADARCRETVARLSQEECRGAAYIRQIYDAFLYPVGSFLGLRQQHLCLVYEPALVDLHSLQQNVVGQRFDVQSLRTIVKSVLLALQFLHDKAHVVHCDVKADNLLCDSADPGFFESIAEKLEIGQVSIENTIRMVDIRRGKRKVYRSTSLLELSPDPPFHRILLSDFGEAVSVAPGEQREWALICHAQYRPPEIHLGLQWDSAVDIWAVGVMIWRLFYGQFLFGRSDGTAPTSEEEEAVFLFRMHQILGPPPAGLLSDAAKHHELWDSQSNWEGGDLGGGSSDAIWEWESQEWRLEGGEKTAFLRFVRSMLTWRPADRKSAKELLCDPWLNEEFSE